MPRPSTEAWDISESRFPIKGTDEEKLEFLLGYAILAPSSHNSQPWLFKIKDSKVSLYIDRTRGLPVSDTDDRELTISSGAALYNLYISLRHFGYDPSITQFANPEDPDLAAEITMAGKKEETAEEHLLFSSINRRRTNRMPFEPRLLPEGLLKDFERYARESGVWFHVLWDEHSRDDVASLIMEGDRIQASDKMFRRELSAWVHPNRTISRDGMPGYAFGIGDIASYAGPLLIRTFDWGEGQAAKDHQLAIGSPVMAVLGTNGDKPKDWLVAGYALEKILLRASSEGVSASYMNQPIEVKELRNKLREAARVSGFPQMLMRMGYGAEVPPTPRRSVNEVLLKEE